MQNLWLAPCGAQLCAYSCVIKGLKPKSSPNHIINMEFLVLLVARCLVNLAQWVTVYILESTRTRTWDNHL